MSLADQLNQIDQKKALIVGLVIAIFYYGLFYDDGRVLKAQIENARSEEQRAEEELVRLTEERARIRQYQLFVEALGDSFDALINFMPESMTSSDLMKAISTEATTAGLNIISLGDGQASGTDDSFYEPLSIMANLSGSFYQQMLFLAHLSALKQIVSVDSLQLSLGSLGEAGEDPVINMDISVVGYRYTPQVESEEEASW